jgi:hypothetical protein
MTDQQYQDLVKRIEALEASASVAKSLSGQTIALYPKQVEGFGYATKDSAGVYKAYRDSCRGDLQEIETYDTEYEGKPTVRLVAIFAGANNYRVNVGADTIFAKSLIACLAKASPYVGLEINAKPSAKKQSVVFAEVTMHGSIIKESCQDWTQDMVLQWISTINARIRSGLTAEIVQLIKFNNISKESIVAASQRMFNCTESAKLEISQLRALIREVSNA